MATYGGNSVIVEQSYFSTTDIATSGGVVPSTLVYTAGASDNFYTLIRPTGWIATNQNSNFINVKIDVQKLGLTGSNWFTVSRYDIATAGGNSNGNEISLDVTPVTVRGTDSGEYGNFWIRLMPGERMMMQTHTATSTSNGAIVRVVFDTLRYHNS